MNLLLLSNSTNVGEDYLAYSKLVIRNFLLKNYQNIVFIPYAGVTIDWEKYTNHVNNALKDVGLKVNPVNHSKDPLSVIQMASAIMIGGGNSFQLLKLIQDQNLIDVIREKVLSGTPYVGWSAGANIVCPTIKTTNDMPIAEPESLNSLNLINFQINPHYTEDVIPNHGGESRLMRLEEYITVNHGLKVIGLPEGMMIERSNEVYHLIGEYGCKIIKYGEDSVWIRSDEELNDFLLK